MWREAWTVLFVICLILSGTTSNVAATAQTMQIFHTFNVTLGENGLNIEITPGSLIDFNVTNLNTSYAIGDLNATVLNASNIEVFNETLMETFNNDTLHSRTLSPSWKNIFCFMTYSVHFLFWRVRFCFSLLLILIILMSLWGLF